MELQTLEPAAPAKTAFPLKLRLYVMMFLQYFVQGSYFPVATVYLQDGLGFTASQIGYFTSAISVGPLIAPFVIGQVIDRHVSTQYVLAFNHVLGGLVMIALYTQTQPSVIIALGTIYSVLYIPTLMLTNSLTFAHLANRDREFPFVRLWGTIGFVAPAWLIETYLLEGLEGAELNRARGVVLLSAGLAGLAMGVYSLTLPKTPPAKSAKDFAPAKAANMLRYRHFLVLVLVSFGIAIVHNYFFTWNSPFLKATLRSGDVAGAWEQRISSLGQISEVAVMAGLGLLLTNIGFKTTMFIGASAYAARFLVLAFASTLTGPFATKMTLVCFGQALHGFCFGCFLATAYIFVDRASPKDVRGSMQSLYGTFVVGFGMFLGGFVSGAVGSAFEAPATAETIRQSLGVVSTLGMETFTKDGVENVRDWVGIWLTGAFLAAVCSIAFLLAFPAKAIETEETAGR